MTESKAMILGCAGKSLSRDEIRFYRGECPWGFILFARNIGEPEQIRDLVAEMRDCIGRPDAPVFIDQEGGRVQRLRPPLAPNYPAGAALGALWRDDHDAGNRAAWLLGRLHAFDLARYGLTADCLPVLDVPIEGASDVIGARAYGKEPKSVTELGRAVRRGLMAGGVLPVVKHLPGYGRAAVDPHLALPVVSAPRAELELDFAPFRAHADAPMGMTAHLVIEAVDPEYPVTFSGPCIDLIRDEIGFEGLLMTDDISMGALQGSTMERVEASLGAGCDIVLHCNGEMAEMEAAAAAAGALTGAALKRAEAVDALSREVEEIDIAEVRRRYDALSSRKADRHA